MSQASQFWLDVNEQLLILRAAAAKSSMQPRDGRFFYMSTLRRRGGDPTARAGAVFESAPKLAAQRVVKGEAELASDDQVRAHLEDQERRRAAVLSASARGKGTVVFAAPTKVIQ